jgi:two-component system, OmpR family, phosphate regulon sensor histidine kinase PhoR
VKLGVRAKLFAVSLALIALSLAAGEFYLRAAIERDLVEQIRVDLKVRLGLVADSAQALGTAGDNERVAWDALADRLGLAAQARVTFVDRSGAVLGDSEIPAAALATAENHRDRPEIAAALQGRSQDSVRYSATLQQRLLYAAQPVPGSTGVVARVSVPLTTVDLAVAELRRILLIGGAIALLAAVLLSFVASVLMARALRGLTAVARRMSGGDLEVRSRLEARDEIGELGRTLDHLAESLSRSLRELRDDRDLLGRILESMREGVLVLDAERRVLLLNGSLRDMLLVASDAVGRPAIEVVRNADLQALAEAALSHDKPAEGEIEVGGIKPRRLLVHAARLSGEPRCVLLVFFDVTEIRRLETVRKDFVANVSHELRTPIASVRAAAETLRTAIPADPVAAASFVEIIERNARRLGDLVEDLLDLSRIESREFRLKSEPIDLSAVTAQVAAACHERIERKRIRFLVSLPATLPAPRGDAAAVERVLVNLVENAAKYGPEGGSITVGAAEKAGQIEVTVADSGPGIEGRHLPRLFERFYRVDPGRSREMGGTGLGLSIVKNLVEAMGGEVGVESTPGKGSTFRFTLPRA